MELTSEPQQGTRFTLHIPIHESHQPQRGQVSVLVREPKSTRRRESDKDIHILIIESHSLALNMMGEILNTKSVYLHDDANTALNTHDLSSIDLILCDARLPAGGTEAVIRALGALPNASRPSLGLITSSRSRVAK